jgi:heat shock protein HslJ
MMMKYRLIFTILAGFLAVSSMLFTGCSDQYVAPSGKTAVSKTALLHTTWRVTVINGSRVVFRPGQKLDVSLIFSKGGQFSGTTGCNYLNGSYALKKERLSFSSLAITRMACSPQLMAQEREYLGAIRKVSSYAISGNSLKLFNAEGGKLMELIAVMLP